MGIVWTTVFPSHDAHVIAPLCIGFFFLVLFALWETYGNLKHPLTPTYVFKSSHGRDLTAPCIALAVVNMFYYSSSIIWPTMIYVFYTNGGTDWRYAVILSIVQGLAISFGAVLLAYFGSKIRHWQWQLTGSVFVMVLFGTLLALGTPDNKGLMVAFVFLSQTGYGWAIYLSIAVSQMGVDHKDLDLSGGIAGVSRFAAGSSKSYLSYLPYIAAGRLTTSQSWRRGLHHGPQQHGREVHCSARPSCRHSSWSLAFRCDQAFGCCGNTSACREL